LDFAVAKEEPPQKLYPLAGLPAKVRKKIEATSSREINE
jgi:hypothetical protein